MGLIFAYVFIPESWVGDDEITHYFDKPWIVHDCYITAMFLDPVLTTLEVDVVADEYFADVELTNET